MKKSFVSFVALLVVGSAQAGTINCENSGREKAPSQSDLKLTATIVSAEELRDIKVKTVQDAISGKGDDQGVGRLDVATANPNYKPRKFLNSNQFVLSLNGDKANDYGVAVDECQFVVMLSKDIMSFKKSVKFKVPMLSHCEQNGGREDLVCILK